MKRMIITFCFLVFCLSSFEQEMIEHIPEQTKAEIDAKLSVYGKQLKDFRKWLQYRKNETAQLNMDSNGHTTTSHVLFGWPLRVNSNYDNIPSYYEISNYMDINRDNNGYQKDWYCNISSEALNYRYHEGNDYSSYPFFWRMMENNNVLACAAHSGIVIEVVDTINNSYNCMRDSLENNNGNHVTILNPDSSISQYFHIKTGSAMVAEGQYVEEGKLLAYVASSGHTSNPHLHFDLRYYRASNNHYNYVEPYKKSPDDNNDCNPFTTDSWWENQKTYVEPKLNRVMTHSLAPQIHGTINGNSGVGFCPEEENARAKNQFNPGEVVVVGVALTHVSRYDSVFIRIYFPGGNPWTSTGVPNPLNGWRRNLYLTRGFTLPSNAPNGTYIIQVDYTYRPFDPNFEFAPQTTPVTKSYRHFFTVGCVASETIGNVTTTLEWGHIVGNDLHSSEIIQGKELYQSGNFIQLTPGFNAQAGCILKARIKDCNYSE